MFPLAQIDLSNNNIGTSYDSSQGTWISAPEGPRAIADAIRDSRSLTVADIRFNQFDTESATMLATIAKEKKISLCGITPDQTEANLQGDSGTRMSPADAILLTADLAVRVTLSRLLIGGNAIMDKGCIALAEAMQQNESCKIEELSLRNNRIGFAGARSLVAMMAVKGSLTMADLRYNDLNTESARMLTTIAKKKKISLCGIAPDQTEANMNGYGKEKMGPADVILLTADLATRGSLTSVE